MRRPSKLFAIAGLAVATAGFGVPTVSAADRVSTASLDADATFRFAYYRDPPTLDPAKIQGGIDYASAFLVMDRLFHQTPTGEIEPGIAESASVSDDGLVWELTIRGGLTFHDGAALDADAVVANLERARTMEASTVKADLAAVDSVTATAPGTVEITLSRPEPALDLILSERAGLMISPDSFESDRIDTIPVGSGMYRMTDRVVGSSMTFERFDEYWESGAAAAAAFEMVILPDAQARLNAVQTGEVDATFVDAEFVADAMALPGVVVDATSGLRTVGLMVNPELVPAWADERVREAVDLGVDRQAIIDAVLFGHAEPTDQPLPEGMPGHVESEIVHDPDRARSLLAEAGYADGFSMTGLLSTSPSVQLAEAIQAQLAEIGIDITIDPRPGNAASQEYFFDQTADALFVPYPGQLDPVRWFEAVYSSDGRSNPGGLALDGMDELLDEAAVTGDAETRTALVTQMSQLLVDGTPTHIPLFRPYRALVMAEDVVGLEWYQSGYFEFPGVGIAAE